IRRFSSCQPTRTVPVGVDRPIRMEGSDPSIEDGKTIRTTGNHPYLVKTRLFQESKIENNGGNYRQRESNQNAGVDINQINTVFHRSFLNLTAANKNTIAQIKSPVNTKIFSQPLFLEKFGTINTTPNQPADKLINTSEKTDIKTESNLIAINLTNKTKEINGIWSNYHQSCN
ncbi:MAG: hypothetical protein U1C50_01985, partial [Patescibacteria group bacterium]|nr:hypothetical protein [Patescibacteria group bacterium]